MRALGTVYHHHTLSYAESVASTDFSKFSSQEQTAGEDFLLQFNPTQGGTAVGKYGAIIYLLSGLPVVDLL